MHVAYARKLVVPFAGAALFCGLLFLFYPYRTTFQFDTDEGVNLIKARLVERGCQLYSEVWSDQPPVFTLSLARLFRWMQDDLNAARHLVLAFAGLLAASLAFVVQRVWGGWQALLAVFLLLLTPFVPALSVSVMIGLPALALAFASLAILMHWHSRPHPIWLLLSGALLGYSVMTKLFTGFLVPVFQVGIILAAGQAASFKLQAALKPLLLWSLAFFLVLAGICLNVIGPAQMLELILPHLEAGMSNYYQGYQEEYSRFELLAGALPIFGLALLGAWSALRRRQWLALYLMVWLLGGLGFFVLVSPAWYHHTLLLTLPAVCLAAGGLGEAFGGLARLFHRQKISLAQVTTTVAGLGLVVVLLWQRLPPVWEEFDHQPYFIALQSAQPASEQVILDEITPFGAQIQWMFTDLPMFAFQSDILVPPELAVLTSKRLASGELPQAEITRLVTEYRPEIILLGRFEYPGLEALLSADYRLYSSHLDTLLYLRADLKDLE